jgi:hypothetical protein
MGLKGKYNTKFIVQGWGKFHVLIRIIGWPLVLVTIFPCAAPSKSRVYDGTFILVDACEVSTLSVSSPHQLLHRTNIL